MTLYSGAFVLVDTNTSTGIHYIEMMTLYDGAFVLVDILILIPVYSWHPVLLLMVYQEKFSIRKPIAISEKQSVRNRNRVLWPGYPGPWVAGKLKIED